MTEPSPTPAVPRVLPLVLAAIGLVVSGVLEWVHVATYLAPASDSFCTLDRTFDCNQVALSRLSVVLGVPMPLWGMAGFLAMLVAAWHRLRLLWPLAALAAVASVVLLLEELLFVGAVCLLCEAVHLVAVLLAGVAWWWHRKRGQPATRRTWIAVAGPPVGIVLATVLFVPPYWAPLTWQRGVPHPHGVDDDGHHWVGAESPVVTVEEFIDYGCPHCAIATNLTRRRLAAHGDRLRVVRRHQPRMRCNETNMGCLTLRAAHCAGQQGKFWPMDAWLFIHGSARRDIDVVAGARTLELDEATFVACLSDPATFAWADAEAKAARKLKIDMTPTYRVDGQNMFAPQLDALLDARL
jgi:uncharacterized membrane protein